MEELKSEDQHLLVHQFSRYAKQQIHHADLEKLYIKAHKTIRESPFKISTTDAHCPTWHKSNASFTRYNVTQTLQSSQKSYSAKCSIEQRMVYFKQKLHSLDICV